MFHIKPPTTTQHPCSYIYIMSMKSNIVHLVNKIRETIITALILIWSAVKGLKQFKIKEWAVLIFGCILLGILIDEVVHVRPLRNITNKYGTCVKAVIYDKYLNHTARWDNFYFYYYQFNYNGKQYRDAFHRLKGHQDMQIGDSIPVYFFSIYPQISYEEEN